MNLDFVGFIPLALGVFLLPMTIIDMYLHYKKDNTMRGYIDSWRLSLNGKL